jgi:hypothetical protein
VANIVDNVDLYIAPLINPDGRLFDQLNPPADAASGGWRKNRRPNVNPAKVGVDLNRNHDIAWKFEDYYDMAVYLSRYPNGPPASTDRASLTYRGPSVASEPETQNVQWMADTKKPRYFVDIHQFGRKVLTAWGIEDNGTDPTMNFSATAGPANATAFDRATRSCQPAAPITGNSSPTSRRTSLPTASHWQAPQCATPSCAALGSTRAAPSQTPDGTTRPTTSARAPRYTIRLAAR